MKTINGITLILTIVGGLSWGLMGLFGLDPVAALLDEHGVWLRTAYLVAALASLWQLYPLILAFRTPQVPARRYWA